MAKKKQAPTGQPVVINSAFELVAVNKLRPHPENPRQGDIGAIYESIQSNGFYGAVVVQRSTGYILAGNHRFQAAVESGIAEVPVAWVDVDDDRARRILLADNRTNDMASYDDAALADLLKRVLTETDTLAGTGYEPEDLDDLIKRVEGDAYKMEQVTAPDQVKDLIHRYEIIIECDSEEQQVAYLERLTEQGYRCKALIS